MIRNNPMGHNNYTGCGVELFSDYELEVIHKNSLEVLEKTGVRVESEKARKIYEQGGANVDHDNEIVKIPPYMVDEAIRTSPGHVHLAGVDSKHDVMLGDGRVNFHPFGTGINVIDPYTGKCRKSLLKDIADTALLTDALDQIDVGTTTVMGRDVESNVYCLHAYEAQVRNCTKHCVTDPEDGERAILLLEMAGLIVGGKEKLKERPIVSAGLCAISPLEFCAATSDILIEFAKNDVPSTVLSMAMAGGTAPVTLAGTIIVLNAEVLAGVVLSQLVKKGSPIIYGSSTTNLDLRKGACTVGSPEIALISTAVSKLAKEYNLPCLVAGG